MPMANLDTDLAAMAASARRRAGRSIHIDRAQRMLIAAGLTAFGIVAVAAAMLGMLF